VLLDVMMPRLDGIETIKRLKADPSLPFMPVIMLTAQSDKKEVVAGLDAGADEYLTKPFDAGALMARVRAMLRMKVLHDEVRTQATQLARWNQKLEQRVAEQLAALKHLDWLKRFLAARRLQDPARGLPARRQAIATAAGRTTHGRVSQL
jgi:adenylate cyclase